MARDAQQRGPRRRGHREGRRRRLGSAGEILDACAGTGAFWNSTTRLLDGFKLLSAPETGISIGAVPGPRGPVTFRDLYLRGSWSRRPLAQNTVAGLGPHGRQERCVAPGEVARALLEAGVLVELLAELEMIAVEDQSVEHLVCVVLQVGCGLARRGAGKIDLADTGPVGAGQDDIDVRVVQRSVCRSAQGISDWSTSEAPPLTA